MGAESGRLGILESTSLNKATADILSLGSVLNARERLAEANHAFTKGEISRLIIVGAGPEGRRLAGLCAALGIDVTAVFDDNPAIHGHKVGGVTVRSFLPELVVPDIPVVIASHRVLSSTRKFRDAGSKWVAPFALLQVLEPDRYPPHMFYNNLIEDLFDHTPQIEQLEDRLDDELSRRTLQAVIDFRLTLDPEVLIPVLDCEHLYAPPGVTFGDDEIYVDAGAFDGDSVRLFQERVGGRYRRILAFEPDNANFDRLRRNFMSEPRVETINAGLWDHTTKLRFRDEAGRLSGIDQDGPVEMSVVALDDVLGDDPATFIKMNIEGAEEAALHGSRQVISRHMPKLAVSAYHRSTDIWRLPQVIDEITEGYRLTLRQQDMGIVETVLYAVAK